MSAVDVRGHALVAAAAVGWGTWSLFFRNAERLGPISSHLEGAVMMGVLAIVTLPLALRSRRPVVGQDAPADHSQERQEPMDHASKRAAPTIEGRVAPAVARGLSSWMGLAAIGVVDSLNVLLFFKAMQLTTVAIAVLSHSISPVLVALVSPWVLREARRWSTVAAAIVAFSGLTLLLEPWASPATGALVGAACGASSAIFTATNVLGQKRLLERFSAAEMLSYHSIVAALILAAFVPAGGWELLPRQWILLLLGSLGPGALGGLAWAVGLSRIPATHASMLIMLEPCVAVVLGVTVWGEHLGALGLIGGALVLVGLNAAIRK